jgi:hypothetical protein
MSRTLLFGRPDVHWRDWIKEHRGRRDLLVLDPADADHGPAGRVLAVQQDRVVAWRYVGTTDTTRNPVALLQAAVELGAVVGPNAIIQGFPLPGSLGMRQLAMTLAQMLRPGQILVAAGSALEKDGWPVGAEPVDLPRAFPPMVTEAQRRARWLELREQSSLHTLDLPEISVQGGRLGAGRRARLEIEDCYAEVAGGVLHLITDTPIEEDQVARLLNLTHATRLSVVSPSAYRGLVCSLADQEGQDFAMGIIDGFDPTRRTLNVLSPMVAGAPARIVKLGMIKVDETGREEPPVAAWTL